MSDFINPEGHDPDCDFDWEWEYEYADGSVDVTVYVCTTCGFVHHRRES